MRSCYHRERRSDRPVVHDRTGTGKKAENEHGKRPCEQKPRREKPPTLQPRWSSLLGSASRRVRVISDRPNVQIIVALVDRSNNTDRTSPGSTRCGDGRSQWRGGDLSGMKQDPF